MAFNNNEFRWSPRIKREDGAAVGCRSGTRAVDRVGNDYPPLVSPGQPGIRVNVMPDQVIHYSQKAIDVINLNSRQARETHSIEELVGEIGANFPIWDRLLFRFGTASPSAGPTGS